MTCPRCNQFHRRAQLAEAALQAVDPERLERAGQSGGSLGRTLLRWHAGLMQRQRDEALAVAEKLAEALHETLTTGPDDAAMEVLERWQAVKEATR